VLGEDLPGHLQAVHAVEPDVPLVRMAHRHRI
jgi:hypothetical protein